MSAFCYLQPTSNRFFNDCIKLYWILLLESFFFKYEDSPIPKFSSVLISTLWKDILRYYPFLLQLICWFLAFVTLCVNLTQNQGFQNVLNWTIGKKTWEMQYSLPRKNYFLHKVSNNKLGKLRCIPTTDFYLRHLRRYWHIIELFTFFSEFLLLLLIF